MRVWCVCDTTLLRRVLAELEGPRNASTDRAILQAEKILRALSKNKQVGSFFALKQVGPFFFISHLHPSPRLLPFLFCADPKP